MGSKMMSGVRVLAIVVISTLAVTAVVLAQTTMHESSSASRPASSTRGVEAAEEAVPAPALQAYGRLPLAFIENRGQLDGRARFVARRGGTSAYFTRDAFVVQLVPSAAKHPSPKDVRPLEESPEEHGCLEGVNVFLTFEGTSSEVVVDGIGELPGRYNYFRGKDPSQWHTQVPAYASIRYRCLYPGIDVVVREQDGRLEYDLLLAPGADPAQIVVRCEGQESLGIDEHGSLVLATAAGRLEQPRPITYQVGVGEEREPVACTYRLLGANCFGFDVPSLAREKSLVIDPGLVYSTFLGSFSRDEASGIAVDATGATLVTGETESIDFPTTPGAFDTALNGSLSDVFVTKLSGDGSSLLYSTFLGSDYNDAGYGIAVDATGAALVTGTTGAPDFPTTAGAYDTTFNGGGDVFVAKVSADGSSLLYSTFLGGSGPESGHGIVVDATGAALVTGSTLSSDFPTTPGAYDTTLNGSYDVLVSKLSADGSRLLYSTFLGGSGSYDYGMAIGVDSTSAALVTGLTLSSDFPTTPGAYDTTFNNGHDVFIAKLSADGSGLVYATFLGGTGHDSAMSIAVDATGAALVTGVTFSSDFPTTPGAYVTSFNGESDAFVAKLNAGGNNLIYSTFLGGSSYDVGYGIAVDATGAALVTGSAYSSDFPATPGAYDTTYNGSTDAFVAKLSADGSSLLYSTFLGGLGDDYGFSIAVDTSGAAFVTGKTQSSDFPTTPGAYDTSNNGSYHGVFDAFVAKLMTECVAGSWTNYGSGWPGTNGVPSFTSSGDPTICAAFTLNLDNSLGANTTAALFLGLAKKDWPTIYDGHLLVVPKNIALLALPAGGLALSALICDDSLCGLSLYLQALEIDGGASKGISFTPGFELRLGVE